MSTYDIQTLQKLVSEIEQANALVTRMGTDEGRKTYVSRHGDFARSAMLGELMGSIMHLHSIATCCALPAIERLRPDPANESVDAEIRIDPKTGMPRWNCEIAEAVPLICPNCHASVDCQINAESDGPNLYAEIETDFCEDCHKHLCPKCPRTSGVGEEEGLVWCLECRPAPQDTGPYTEGPEPSESSHAAPLQDAATEPAMATEDDIERARRLR